MSKLSRAEVEWDLIQAVETFLEVVHDGYLHRRGTSHSLHDWIDWARDYSLLTDEEIGVFRRALEVRNDLLALNEHDRTLESLEQRASALAEIAQEFKKRLVNIPDTGNVVRLRAPDE